MAGVDWRMAGYEHGYAPGSLFWILNNIYFNG